MSEGKHYIHPQVKILLEPMWNSTEEYTDFDLLTEDDVIAMRSEAVAAREGKQQLGPDLPRVQDFQAKGAFGNTRVRLYDPINNDKPIPALIFLHGGGWCGGDIESRDDGTRLLAAGSGVAVLSVDYALAPEHKFPEPLDDVMAVCRWLYNNGKKLGIDTNRIAIGGDSSGANLALAASMVLRNANEQFFHYMMLFYGVFAHDHSTDSHRSFGRDGRYTLSSAAMDFCWRTYLNEPDQDQDLRAAPLLADMSSLPPAYIMCGSLDPLLDDSQQLYEKMNKVGIDATLRIHKGVPHSFLSFIDILDTARQGWKEAAGHLRLAMV